MKILLSTYSACSHTSYGLITRELWKRLAKMHPEWRIYQHGWFHMQEEEVPWPVEPTNVIRTDEGTMTPDRADVHGKLSFGTVVKRFRPDVVWTLGDPYMMDHMGHYRPRYHFKLIKHCPADGSPQPPSWRDAMTDCDLFVPITKYAARVFNRFWPDSEDLTKNVIYHGVNTNVFQPMNEETKKRARLEGGGISEDTFVLGFCGHNQYRKQTWNLHLLTRYLRDGAYWVERDTGRILLDRFDDVELKMVEEHPDLNNPGIWDRAEPRKVMLWMHTFKRGDSVDYPADRLREYYGVENDVRFSEGMTYFTGIPDEAMPAFYNSIDLYLSLSGGEGFCLPLIEAAACGIPCVYTDYSGQAEIGQHSGAPVRPYIIQRQHRDLIGRAIADLGHAVQQIRKFMDDKDYYDRVAAQGYQAARDTFSWDVIATQWEKAIAENFAPRRVNTIGVSL